MRARHKSAGPGRLRHPQVLSDAMRADRSRSSSARSHREIHKDPQQCAQQDQREDEQWTGSPAALLIDGFQFIRERLKEGTLQTDFGIATVNLSQRLAHFLWRNVALRVHD